MSLHRRPQTSRQCVVVVVVWSAVVSSVVMMTQLSMPALATSGRMTTAPSSLPVASSAHGCAELTSTEQLYSFLRVPVTWALLPSKRRNVAAVSGNGTDADDRRRGDEDDDNDDDDAREADGVDDPLLLFSSAFSDSTKRLVIFHSASEFPLHRSAIEQWTRQLGNVLRRLVVEKQLHRVVAVGSASAPGDDGTTTTPNVPPYAADEAAVSLFLADRVALLDRSMLHNRRGGTSSKDGATGAATEVPPFAAVYRGDVTVVPHFAFPSTPEPSSDGDPMQYFEQVENGFRVWEQFVLSLFAPQAAADFLNVLLPSNTTVTDESPGESVHHPIAQRETHPTLLNLFSEASVQAVAVALLTSSTDRTACRKQTYVSTCQMTSSVVALVDTTTASSWKGLPPHPSVQTVHDVALLFLADATMQQGEKIRFFLTDDKNAFQMALLELRRHDGVRLDLQYPPEPWMPRDSVYCADPPRHGTLADAPDGFLIVKPYGAAIASAFKSENRPTLTSSASDDGQQGTRVPPRLFIGYELSRAAALFHGASVLLQVLAAYAMPLYGVVPVDLASSMWLHLYQRVSVDQAVRGHLIASDRPRVSTRVNMLRDGESCLAPLTRSPLTRPLVVFILPTMSCADRVKQLRIFWERKMMNIAVDFPELTFVTLPQNKAYGFIRRVGLQRDHLDDKRLSIVITGHRGGEYYPLIFSFAKFQNEDATSITTTPHFRRAVPETVVDFNTTAIREFLIFFLQGRLTSFVNIPEYQRMPATTTAVAAQSPHDRVVAEIAKMESDVEFSAGNREQLPVWNSVAVSHIYLPAACRAPTRSSASSSSQPLLPRRFFRLVFFRPSYCVECGHLEKWLMSLAARPDQVNPCRDGTSQCHHHAATTGDADPRRDERAAVGSDLPCSSIVDDSSADTSTGRYPLLPVLRLVVRHGDVSSSPSDRPFLAFVSLVAVNTADDRSGSIFSEYVGAAPLIPSGDPVVAVVESDRAAHHERHHPCY